MKCIYCNRDINSYGLIDILYKEDLLCYQCRNRLKLNYKKIKLNDLSIETFYNYDGLFKDLIIQYKECYDEALSKVFLYYLSDYINFKYHGYKLLLVPSSKEKLKLRGFNHLDLIFKDVKLDRVTGLSLKQDAVQEGKSRSERLKMVNNYVYTKDRLNKVLIVDDVLTSGSSLLGSALAIKPYTNKIKCLVLSRKENAFILNNKCDKI